MELFLGDDERDDAHPRELVARAHRRAAPACGDHHLVLTVHGDEPLGIDQKHAVAGGLQLDLTLLDLAAEHILLPAEGEQTLRRVVFMHHVGRHLPDVEVLLAHAQQHGDVLLRHDVALAETRVLILVLDDLRHVVAEDMTHRVLGSNELHFSTSISSPACTRPSLTTTAKMPSVGITHLPVARLISQSL